MFILTVALLLSGLAAAVSADGLISVDGIENDGNTAINSSGAFLCSPNAFMNIYDKLQDDQDVLLTFQLNDMPVEEREIPSYMFKTLIELALMPLVGPKPMFKHLGEGKLTITTKTINDQPAINFALKGIVISEPIY